MDEDNVRFVKCLSDMGWGMYGGDESLYVALKAFCDGMAEDTTYKGHFTYNYQTQMEVCGPAVAWMFIYLFNDLGYLDYGTSPRFGWTEGEGEWLVGFIRRNTLNTLNKIVVEDRGKV